MCPWASERLIARASIEGDQGFALEGALQTLYFVRGPISEISKGAFADHFAVAPAFAQEDSGAGIVTGDGLDVHGN